MSLKPQAPWEIPAETARVAKAAFRKGHPYLKFFERLGVVFEDADFQALFSSTGTPAMAPSRLAVATILQYVEGLTDRGAADAVRSRIDWKYMLGLALEDEGFDHTVLSDFRARLVEGGAEAMLFDRLLQRAGEGGLIKQHARQRTDATHVLACIRLLSRLELVIETMRAALNALAVDAPTWVVGMAQAEWAERYGAQAWSYRLPKTPAQRAALAAGVGRDGHAILEAALGGSAPEVVRAHGSVQALRRIWVQQYRVEAGTVVWRSEAELPPGIHRIRSPYDLDARVSRKRETTWEGYKAHLTETCSEQGPQLITNVETRPAPEQDVKVLEDVHEHEQARGLLASEQIVDVGYISGQTLVEARARGVELIGPGRKNSSRHAREATGYGVDQFQIDWEAKAVTCPQGRRSVQWRERGDPVRGYYQDVIFATATCRVCPVRGQCTTAKQRPRRLSLPRRAEHEAIRQARAREQTDEFKTIYRTRSGIEGTISQAVRGFGLRRARYRGMAKVRLEHYLIATAINVVRIAEYLMGRPPERTRTPAFVALVRGKAA